LLWLNVATVEETLKFKGGFCPQSPFSPDYNLRKTSTYIRKPTKFQKMSEMPPSTPDGPNTPNSPEQMMALITELHSELTLQRSMISQLTNVHASQACQPPSPHTVPAPLSFIPKKYKPSTFDGKSSPDSWIAHMTSYIYGLPDQQAFSIAITYLTADAHDWFIANQRTATAAGHPMTS
jgi:hypothetical protein